MAIVQLSPFRVFGEMKLLNNPTVIGRSKEENRQTSSKLEDCRQRFVGQEDEGGRRADLEILITIAWLRRFLPHIHPLGHPFAPGSKKGTPLSNEPRPASEHA